HRYRRVRSAGPLWTGGSASGADTTAPSPPRRRTLPFRSPTAPSSGSARGPRSPSRRPGARSVAVAGGRGLRDRVEDAAQPPLVACGEAAVVAHALQQGVDEPHQVRLV